MTEAELDELQAAAVRDGSGAGLASTLGLIAEVRRLRGPRLRGPAPTSPIVRGRENLRVRLEISRVHGDPIYVMIWPGSQTQFEHRSLFLHFNIRKYFPIGARNL